MLSIDMLSKLDFCCGFPSHRMPVVDSCLSLSKWWLKVSCKYYSSSWVFHIQSYFLCMFWSCSMFSNFINCHIIHILSSWHFCLSVAKIAMKSITRSNSNATVFAMAVLHAGSMILTKVSVSVGHANKKCVFSVKMVVSVSVGRAQNNFFFQ